MKIVNQKIEILDNINGQDILKKIEQCGRICYKSENKITDKSASEFVNSIIKNGHESVLEHVNITVKFTIDRAIANELVRHRIASYSQESTRYCNYSKDKFDNQITVIEPLRLTEEQYNIWHDTCLNSEKSYIKLIESGCKPELARDILPLCLKTEIVSTMNLRAWRNVLKQRTAKNAHPKIKQIMLLLLSEFKSNIPVVFDDVG